MYLARAVWPLQPEIVRHLLLGDQRAFLSGWGLPGSGRVIKKGSGDRCPRHGSGVSGANNPPLVTTLQPC